MLAWWLSQYPGFNTILSTLNISAFKCPCWLWHMTLMNFSFLLVFSTRLVIVLDELVAQLALPVELLVLGAPASAGWHVLPMRVKDCDKRHQPRSLLVLAFNLFLSKYFRVVTASIPTVWWPLIVSRVIGYFQVVTLACLQRRKNHDSCASQNQALFHSKLMWSWWKFFYGTFET